MAGDDGQLNAAKNSYQIAKNEGNRQEEARWANVVGDIFKNRGEYVKALEWFRKDYDVSDKYLTSNHLLPTCQCIGEVYLRLEEYDEALKYQKKHLQLAKDEGDIVEQQRASTQLGRTYYELFLKSENDHNSLRNAKKYFKFSMELAQILKEKPSTSRSFIKEYIDALNNTGLLEMELDNLEEAQKILTKGLDICDEEEVCQNDEGRTRLHHHLGLLYTDLRMWDDAREHIERDIIICNRIEHRQGESKGYINLGELHYRFQKYDEANRCYQKALKLAKSMEDEDALVEQIKQNIRTVKEAIKVMNDLKIEEQNFKKLTREIATARGTPNERKCLLQQNVSLDLLIEKSRMILAWPRLCEFAKRKKRVSDELCDKEKLSDSYLVIGESYEKLREYNKALKWYTKSWKLYKSIGNMEGQAFAKNNIGNVLDNDGDWRGALDAYKQSYRIAVDAKLPSSQLSALENMHYSHMIRFDNAEEARKLQLLIDNLKKSMETKPEIQIAPEDCCSETETEGNDHLSSTDSDACCTSKTNKSNGFKSVDVAEEFNDETPLLSLIQSIKNSTKKKTGHIEIINNSITPAEVSPNGLSRSSSSQQKTVGRKRTRVILSDDETECSNGKTHKYLVEGVSTSDEFKSKNNLTKSTGKFQVVSGDTSKCAHNEENSSSYKCKSLHKATKTGKFSRSLSNDEAVNESDFAAGGSTCDINVSTKLFKDSAAGAACPKFHASEHDKYITFNIEEDLIHVEASSFMADDQFYNIDSVKAEVACLYYLQLPIGKRSDGLLPIIRHLKCAGSVLESLDTVENLKDHSGKFFVEVCIDGWVQKRLIKLYIDCCKELTEAPNMKLLKKLYNLEVSDDEIMVSDCELQDLSITPLLNALLIHKTFSMLDLSHNLLGIGTMEKLQKVLATSGQTYGGLTLDLHCNRFGSTALFQICECSVLFARLEVLNISGNRLTDACGSYLSTILEKCTALCSLNIERCSITSRTIQKIADALDCRSVLAQLYIGHNVVSGNAIINLLAKISTLKRFSELNMNGLKLGKPVIDRLCLFVKTTSLSGLMLGSTGIGIDGAMQLTRSLFNETQELVKLDLSYCGLTYNYLLNTDITLICSIFELKLEGNVFGQEGSNMLHSLLSNPQCCLRVLVLRKCKLGLAGVLNIIQALTENNYLEEINLDDNADPNELSTLQCESSINGCSHTVEPNVNQCGSCKELLPLEVDASKHGICSVNSDCHQLEVADSEDIPNREAAASGVDDSSDTSCQRNSSSPESRFIQQLSNAIGMAKHLQLLDLSNNGFSTEAAETLYMSWSSTSRVGSSQKHIKDRIIHFSVKENKCCREKPCCRKD
ncbi:Protein TONSOKU like [Quillaja saponaria]|uniref:Protein TONSOKU n=1 Tax=Quillaja saponaria TaxID=32244 RepID=A0AAD7KSL2_QUISA|nr:Protein TONSOKU like [Quillaja saponaria]